MRRTVTLRQEADFDLDETAAAVRLPRSQSAPPEAMSWMAETDARILSGSGWHRVPLEAARRLLAEHAEAILSADSTGSLPPVEGARIYRDETGRIMLGPNALLCQMAPLIEESQARARLEQLDLVVLRKMGFAPNQFVCRQRGIDVVDVLEVMERLHRDAACRWAQVCWVDLPRPRGRNLGDLLSTDWYVGFPVTEKD